MPEKPPISIPEATPDTTGGSSPDLTRFFDKPGNVKRILVVLYIACAAVLGLDFVVERHIDHPWEELFGFHALYGFVVCVALVLAAKELRKLLMRPDTYYESEDDG